MAPELERWIDVWRGPVVGLISAWGVPRAEAHALAQEVFARAWLARGRFRGDPTDVAGAGPWLNGIARNVHRAWLRERARRRGADLDPDRLAAPADPEEDERLEPLRAAMAALRPPLREALYAHDLEGTPVRQVAALLGVSEKALEARLHRARVELRRELARWNAEVRG